MARSRQSAEWARAADLMAVIHNCAFGCQEPLPASAFNPFATEDQSAEPDRTPTREEAQEGLAMLRAAIVSGVQG